MTDAQRPIIIKKKKVVAGDGHHGGAWKVAYADFVTAMMAFFLLMWLLGATTEDQRKGIADYFATSIPVATTSGGGEAALFGDSMLTEERLAKSGKFQSRNNRKAILPDEETLESEISRLASKAGLEDAAGRIRVRKTEEGMLIELIDAEGRPLFGTGSAAPSKDLKLLIDAAAAMVARSNADVKITGHTDSSGYASQSYSNWELSADRANAARRMLIDAGVPPRNISEVSGRADREPVNGDADSPANRRIAIVLKDPAIEEVKALR